jgi:hypothetical protein
LTDHPTRLDGASTLKGLAWLARLGRPHKIAHLRSKRDARPLRYTLLAEMLPLLAGISQAPIVAALLVLEGRGYSEVRARLEWPKKACNTTKPVSRWRTNALDGVAHVLATRGETL